jgi:hypothetical protein
MGYPRRKNNINVYQGNELGERRQELLDRITKGDSFLPDSVLHDDLDLGMLDFVKKNFNITSDGEQVPVIPKILTIQRWGEFTNTWNFADLDGNPKLPFISVVRRPDVQPGTNPSLQRTIPDRQQFHYATVPTWNGTQMGADIYRIPQPVAVDITYEITIMCAKFRDLNKFNQIVLQKFSSRQAYTTVKGHYVPIVLERIDDNTPVDLDSRRFYLQTYTFTLLGFLIDEEEFEIKPAVSRLFLMNEFIQSNNYEKKYFTKNLEISVATFIADGVQTVFSVGETIGILFNVTINGLIQERDVDYYHVALTSKITFVEAPREGSIITITYYKGRSSVFTDSEGNVRQVTTEYFEYDGSSLSFTTSNNIDSVISVDINGLLQEETDDFEVSAGTEFTLKGTPRVGSRIGITYLY